MCLLNGEVGGSLTSEVNFGEYEQEAAPGVYKVIKMPLIEIIKEAVHHYGNEMFYNIIVNDLDNRVMELQEYRYDTPMYLFRNRTNDV